MLGLLQMAIQAPTHIHLHCRPGNRHLAHVAMTSLAIDARSQVGLMAEVNEVGLAVHSNQLDWLASLPVASQNLDFCVIRGNEVVAAHAFLHGGYTRHI